MKRKGKNMNTNRNFGTKIVIGLGLGVLAVACADGADEQRGEVREALTITAGDGCAHGICATGIALVATCDPCTVSLCARDPYCCTTAWDATCVGEVTSICGQSCTAPPPVDAGASTCSHPVCATGPALTPTCDSCATALCLQDPYCCTTAWDTTCVGEVTAICGTSCK